MNKLRKVVHSGVVALLALGITTAIFAQSVAGLQMAELTRKLQLNDQQQKQMAPLVERRDKELEALKGNTSLSKLQKLRKLTQIQEEFRSKAGQILSPEQSKKLEALQAERRAKLTGKE